MIPRSVRQSKNVSNPPSDYARPYAPHSAPTDQLAAGHRLRRKQATKKPTLTEGIGFWSLSDELVAAIMSNSNTKGSPFNVVLVCRGFWRIARDKSYPTVWRGLCKRMSTWAVKSKLLDRTLSHASVHAGGWRSLSYEKEAYDPRHFNLPPGAPTDWPTGRWYPLTPSEEAGFMDAIFEQTGGPSGCFRHASDTPLSVFILLDGSGSMTPCFRGIKRFVRNMIYRLRGTNGEVTEASKNSTVAFLQYNDYKVRNELAKGVEEQDIINVPLRSEQLDRAMCNWEDIQKLGGTTRTIHAVESAKAAVEGVPNNNNKLILLISDGVTDDWAESIKELLKIESNDPKAHLLVVGVAACSYYEDEFPTEDTLRLLGKGREHSLFMMSRDNESAQDRQISMVAPG